jgi:hypothetical protein
MAVAGRWETRFKILLIGLTDCINISLALHFQWGVSRQEVGLNRFNGLSPLERNTHNR